LKQTLVYGELSESRLLALAAAMEQASEHPLAKALLAASAAGDGAALPRVEKIQAITGSGVAAVTEIGSVRLGRPAFVAELHGQPIPSAVDALLGQGLLVIAIGSATNWLGFFCLEDEVRESAKAALADLSEQKIDTVMMSGDTVQSARKVASVLGMDHSIGGLSPEGKHEELTRLQGQGHIVAMVGDGVNDAPVLAQAQVSIAMGEGTDLARTQGDVVLLGGDLRVVADGVRVARKTMRIVWQNLLWAFTYNILAIPFAMFGWVTPWMAGLGMSASSLFVVLNALRLQRHN
jgi:Cu2+-exporting ATPase